ncbi:hypothetical protein [Jatrophihabitans fulvus]
MENAIATTTFGPRTAALRLEREWHATPLKTVAGLPGVRGLVSQDESVFMSSVQPTVNYIDPSAVAAAGVSDAGRTGRPPRGEPR